MTSAVLTPAEPSAQPPRKRRRRTAAGGATDDCFTCSKRAVKCDRKRPYCTQCIDIGKECSGYKTTLTWGVGVASRGKLRGMSYPVAGRQDDGNASPPDGANENRRRKTSVSQMKHENAPANLLEQQVPFITLPPIPHNHGPAQPSPSHPIPIPTPQSRDPWPSHKFEGSLESRRDCARHDPFQLPPLQHIQTSFNNSFDFGSYPHAAMSIGSYAETEYYSPPEYPRTPGSMSFHEPITPNIYSERLDYDAHMTGSSYPPGSGHGGEHISPFPINHPQDQAPFDKGDTNAMATTLYDGHAPEAYDSFDFGNDLENEQHSLTMLDTRFSNPFFHLTPRMQSLMDYYDRNICPFLVAFDGDHNPYRKHILQLAINNEGLQSAIAALSTNNMRMRRKERQVAGFIAELPDAAELEVATDEEAFYKQSSIDHLNASLASPTDARSDSVLASLLILCLFHVCDSGFSKFKTQLAGVQKLLSLRSPNHQQQSSREFTQWVEMFFAWFDVMTSAVNDREMQIKGESLDMLDFSANLGALEQFSGCDGRLFKLIARLGRLNLLAQGRPVRSSNGVDRRPTIFRQWSRDSRNVSAKKRGNRLLNPSDYDRVDGNGWGTPIISSSDEDADGTEDGSVDHEDFPDHRKEFWEEWNELDAGQRDLVHINECFRYSALLYTERLSNPILPSSHRQFQDLVSQTLCHITALPVTSCVNKFLLWPLFITGTECVDAVHRSIIRTRCIEIQRESGFFNNISGLEVLEKVWKEYPASHPHASTVASDEEEVKARRRDSVEQTGSKYGQAFRWRRAMERKDGEYIVI
ncbi:hypothetical protein KC338_g2228 [Hortaea werneckii]|nr:hypothetical protein KC338_g2228 [Hortaea werneckii]KAI7353614.1 hypothetical protein KC320_g3934 [Hortaea werneckii]